MSEEFVFEPISVMLSSRCTDKVRFRKRLQPIAVLREAIRAELSKVTIGAFPAFRVWSHEHESVESADRTTWDRCIDEARRARIFLMLYNGHSGWTGLPSPRDVDVGICHQELASAYTNAPRRVRAVALPLAPGLRDPRDVAFQDYVNRIKIPTAQARNGDEAVTRCVEACIQAFLDLARDGAALAATGKAAMGDALAWSRLGFHDRQQHTLAVMRDAMDGLTESRADGKDPELAVVRLKGDPVAFVCSCVPGPMTNAAARELVGQPFLRDPQRVSGLAPGIAGPVHLIACARRVTEAQALKLLGFPDAIAVTTSFGVFVADPVQKIQMVFVANCIDPANTRAGVQRFRQWIEEQGEDDLIVARAKARRRIADLMAELAGDARKAVAIARRPRK